MKPIRVSAPKPSAYRLGPCQQTDDFHMREILRRFHQLRIQSCLQEMLSMRGTVEVLAVTGDQQTLTRIRRKTGAVQYQWTLGDASVVRSRIHGRWIWFDRALTAAEWTVCQMLWARTAAVRQPLQIHPLSPGAAENMSAQA